MQGKWLEDLWGDAKLTHEEYNKLSLRVRLGHATRKRDMEAVQAAEREELVDERIRKTGVALEKLKAPFREFSIVRKWEDSFLSLAFRWKFALNFRAWSPLSGSQNTMTLWMWSNGSPSLGKVPNW